MQSRFYLISSLICLFSSIIISQTISSTAAGGHWNDTKTWTGGVIPGEKNDVIINGPVIIGSPTVNNLTVNSGGSIEDECCNGRTLAVKGDFTNYGTIKDNYGGVIIEVKGNVHNHGKLLQYGLSFSASHKQYLESSNVISCKYIWRVPDGVIKASGALTFDSTTTVELSGDTLDMGSYKLTKIRNIAGAHSFNSGIIYSNGEIDISGANVMHSNLAGDFSLVGSQPMECGGFTVFGNLRIGSGKIITDECCNGRTIVVKGNLINNGIIRDQFGGLALQVEGDVINNSIMINTHLQFSGKHPQKIGGTQPFGTKRITREPDGLIIASNDIIFDSTANVYLNSDTLKMGKFKLIKRATKVNTAYANEIAGGLLVSDGEIDVEGRFASDLDGDFILTGNRPMEFGNCVIHSNLVIAKGKEIADECCSGRAVEVRGNLYNHGHITDHYGGLGIYIHGEVYNYSKITNNRVILIASGGKIPEITGEFDCPLYFKTPNENTPGRIKVAGFLKSNKYLEIQKSLIFEIPVNSTFYNSSNFTINGTLENKGTYCLPAIFSNGVTYKTDEAYITLYPIDQGKCDTVFISSTNTTPYPEMTSSVKRWWRVSANKQINSYTLELKYSDELLNGNDPSTLSAYITQDQGKTWRRISNAANTILDAAKKVITIGTSIYPIAEQSGDIILSSGGIVSTPSVSVSVIGRKQIRVGPPNRYTVSYWNSSDVATDDFFLSLKTGGGVHVKSLILTDTVTGKPVEHPIDSLVYDNEDEVYLFASAIGPNQVRNFDIILTAEPGTTELKKVNAGPVIFVVGYWIAGKLVKKYIKSSMVEGCYEMWRPSGADISAKDAVTEVIVNSLKSAGSKERPVKIIAESAAKEIIKREIGDVIWPLDLAKDILKCMGNTIRGMKDYVTGGFDEQKKDLEKVTSWDPNAKEGPSGYGQRGYIATTAPMTYTIYFENKKEATAPAYKIIVYDTLDNNIFDISTVEFGKMSHSIGITSQTGNILKWEFTAIELPPNVNPPEGEGWVQFTVKPKTNLPTGTAIKNRSTIVFDLNPPLSTNFTVNTLDLEAPVTTVNSPKYIEDRTQVYLEWTGDDKSGAGIKTSTVFMANGEAPYRQAAVSDSGKALITVLPGQAYKFYVLSQDNVGNQEKTPNEIKQILTGVDESKAIPEKFQLMQNYPNPFNSVATIKFTLTEAGHSTLKVYNILGEVVRVLLESEMGRGYHRVQFNAEDLASGVYFYQLRQNNHYEVRKMMLIK